jgi:formylglycine-generating enzyme required for sulfatase activity
MAGKHALLIGISTYGEGLLPIPSALKDVEAMREVLLDPELGGVAEDLLQVLTNPGRVEMESAIEGFYADKDQDDLLLLYFSGHGFRQNDRQLLLSTSQSTNVTRDGRTNVHRPTTLSARDVRAYMDGSRSRRQVVILDCCFSAAFALGWELKKDGGSLAIEELLGRKGRAVLASSDVIETSQAAEEGEGLSVYTRFLVEGIQTGAAAGEGRDWLSPRDLHHYAAQRVGDLAPTMTPQFIHTEDGDLIRVCRVRRDPGTAYRQKVQELVEKQAGVITAAGRAILDDLRQELGLAPDQTERIEAEVLQPFRDYDAKLARYRATVAATLEARGNQPERLTPQDREELKELEQRLKLRAADVAASERQLGLHRSEESLQAQRPPRAEEPTERAGIQGPPLIMIPATRGWLVREGNEWRKKEEPITVKGYLEELAEGVAITMLQIPAGAFLMGSPEKEAERRNSEGPQHKVKLRSVFLGQTPVTQAQWKVVAGWPAVGMELNPDPSKFKGASRPVECVSWEEAMEFCQRLRQRVGMSYSLPSEAQWEYACRAGTTTPFAFGETLTTDLANYDGNFTYGSGPKGRYREETSEVGRYPENAWGLQDMHGNVWEWCLDIWHDSYNGAPSDGSAWGSMSDTSSSRLLRGGSWSFVPRGCRSAYRGWVRPDFRGLSIGFRVCCLPQD